MIPTGGSITEAPTEEAEQPSLTYRLDIANGRIRGMVDGIEAVKQAVFKLLQSDRFRHAIYSFDYGQELNTLIGRNALLVQSEAARMIGEALQQDDRITGVQGVVSSVDEDGLNVDFTVISIYGSFQVSQGVSPGV